MTRDIQHPTRRNALTACAGALAWLGSGAAYGQGVGAPMRIIVPTGPASGLDGLIRTAQAALGRELGAPVVIENLPGAGGVIGTGQLVKAAPDGKTIAVIGNNHSVNPSIYKSMPFDSLADITPICLIGAGRFLLVVNTARLPGVTNAAQLQAALRAKPDTYNYASSGNGTIIHLGAEAWLHAAGVRARHIPYKTLGQMTNDVAGGQVDFGMLPGNVAKPHIVSGAMKAVGVMGTSRLPWMPEMPTMKEQGFTDVDVSAWMAVIGPKGMKEQGVKRIHGALVAAWAAPEVKEAMARQEFQVNISSPSEAAQFMKVEEARYRRVVQQADIKVG